MSIDDGDEYGRIEWCGKVRVRADPVNGVNASSLTGDALPMSVAAAAMLFTIIEPEVCNV